MTRTDGRGDRSRGRRGLRKAVRKAEKQVAALEKALGRVERKLVEAQVILTKTAVRASDLDDRVARLRAAGDGRTTTEDDAPGDAHRAAIPVGDESQPAAGPADRA